MSDDLKFQLRLALRDEFAQAARNDPGDAFDDPAKKAKYTPSPLRFMSGARKFMPKTKRMR